MLLQQHDWFFSNGEFDKEEKVRKTTAVALLVQRAENAMSTGMVLYSDALICTFIFGLGGVFLDVRKLCVCVCVGPRG